MQWGPDADAKLFVHVLKIHNVKLNYEALASAMGHDVTAKALMHRIGKLKSMASTSPPPATTTTNPAANDTPAATTATGNAKAAPNAKDKKKTAAGGKAPKRTANGGIKNAKAVAAAGAGGNGENGFPKNGVAAHDVDDDEEEEEARVKPSGRKRVKTEMADEEGLGEDAGGEERA